MQVNRQIEEKKDDLKEAEEVKKFHIECEKLKDDIVQIPSCTKLNKNIEETKKQTDALRKQIKHSDELNEHRKVLLGTLLDSVGALERSMEDPQKDLYDEIRLDQNVICDIQEGVLKALSSSSGVGEDVEMKDTQ